MNTKQPELPAAYELVTFKEVECLRKEAHELAKQGANEGTLIWARQQTKGRGRLNKEWHSGAGDLHCSIILRPEFPFDQFSQIMVVATVSLAHALATHLSAMTALAISWPNDIMIADHKVAAVWLDAGGAEGSRWLAVTTSVNIMNSPEQKSILAMSINEAEGKTDLYAQLLLETFAKQFITQINNWAEKGMVYMVKQWKIRGPSINDPIKIKLRDEEITGVLQSISDEGSAKVLLEDDSVREISLMQCVELEGSNC